ncbi:hypothetical protein PEPE_1054 [Pediococcus pentosaceus ATCC 25745]|uniref:Uncharacterized protein n=1 Tax=Pediococcus pentosaceus (strain ATCC 25745 / CCUG 21536 / LMG 10740 / 183-1w) TaxID=278197 RepID=Q03FB2_PEDPA|nr:hypothetical protein PEPE_1054 [Pediococcus pentosaceus ATCC 25745]
MLKNNFPNKKGNQFTYEFGLLFYCT